MHRPENYKTRQGEAVLAYLATVKDMYTTAPQIADHLHKEHIDISRLTVYRQLEKLVKEGRVRKYLFDGETVSSFRYVDPNECRHDAYHLKCEGCGGLFDLQCDEVDHVSQHILETHDFKVNGSKTVFYGQCKLCLPVD